MVVVPNAVRGLIGLLDEECPDPVGQREILEEQKYQEFSLRPRSSGSKLRHM